VDPELLALFRGDGDGLLTVLLATVFSFVVVLAGRLLAAPDRGSAR
jgi:hypothetical protein